MTDLKINTDSLPPEVTIRTGEAAPNPPRPVKIEFSGKIESPRTWIETQKANFNPTRSHAEANMAQGTIVLYENAREKYSAVVAGTLKPCPIISEFGINSAKYYTPKDLAKKQETELVQLASALKDIDDELAQKPALEASFEQAQVEVARI